MHASLLRTLFGASVLVAAWLSACSLFSDTDGLSGAPNGDSGTGLDPDRSTPQNEDAAAGQDAALADGAADVALVDAGADSDPANLFTNPSFDIGVGGCGIGWTQNGPTIERSTLARSGTYSCRVCAGVTLVPVGLPGASEIAGRSVYFEAWLHAAPDAGAASGGMYVGVHYGDAGGVDHRGIASIPTTDTWQKISTSITMPADLTYIQVHLNTAGAAQDCLLADDLLMIIQ